VAADVDAKVLALVERELKKDPSIQSTELRTKALKIDRSLADLSGRQFHARYALQVRRRLFGSARGGSRGRKGGRRKAGSDAVHVLVSGAYEERRARLDAAIEQAFRQAIKSESFEKVSKLLAALDRHAKELEKA
jgi:hypothetical protein